MHVGFFPIRLMVGLYSIACSVIHWKNIWILHGWGGQEVCQNETVESFYRVCINLGICFLGCFGLVLLWFFFSFFPLIFFFSSIISKKALCVLNIVWIICCKGNTLVLLSYPLLHSNWMRKKGWEWQREEYLVKNTEHFYR